MAKVSVVGLSMLKKRNRLLGTKHPIRINATMVNDGAHLRKQHLVTCRHRNHPPQPIAQLLPIMDEIYGRRRCPWCLFRDWHREASSLLWTWDKTFIA